MHIDLTPAQCEEILTVNHYGHLGCILDGEPYVIPVTYAFRDGFVYGASQEGTKLEAMRKNPTICIQVENIKSGLEWESVICWGFFEEVTDQKSAQDIKLLLAEEYGQTLLQEGKMPVSPIIEGLHQPQEGKYANSVIYRMKPFRITGKSEKH